MSEYMSRFYGMCDECHFMDDLVKTGERYLCYVCLVSFRQACMK